MIADDCVFDFGEELVEDGHGDGRIVFVFVKVQGFNEASSQPFFNAESLTIIPSVFNRCAFSLCDTQLTPYFLHFLYQIVNFFHFG